MTKVLAVTAMVALLCLIVGAQAAVCASYQIVDLGSADGYYSTARAVNNANRVVYDASGSIMLWQEEQTTNLGKMGGSAASVSDIDNDGRLAGLRIYSGYSRAFSYFNGTRTDLGSFNANGSSSPSSINDAGQVVGFSYSSAAFQDHAFLYDPATGLRDIHILGTSSYATGINNASWVTGNYYTDLVGREIHVFLWQNGAMTTIDGMHASSGINDLGMVIGSTMPNSTDTHASFWRNGLVTDIGTLGGTVGRSRATNGLGWIVGDSNTASGGGHGFLWRNGTMLDINSLIDPASGWVVKSAIGVNDNGWIVGQGSLSGSNHAIVLIPVPEPSGMLALLSGAGGLCMFAFRRRK